MPVKKKVTSNKRQVTSKKQKPVIANGVKQSSQTTKPTKIVTKPLVSRNDKLSIPVYSLAGKSTGELSLPKEIFGVEVNKRLLAQALRVYTTNQKTQPGSTKGRGEVEGSTAKIYRQKGTGRARHGAIRAPIFVGGGIVFGPKPRRTRLELPQKMKRVALLSALSSKVLDKKVFAVNLDKASGKTKEIVGFLTKLTEDKKQPSALIVLEEKTKDVVRASRNISQVTALSANFINAYEVLRHDVLVLTKEAIEQLQKMEVKTK